MNAFPKAGGSGVVQRIVKRLGEVIGWEAAEVLLGQCLEDDTGRMLATWKKERPPREPTSGELIKQLEGSLKK